MELTNKQIVDSVVKESSPATQQAFASVDTGDNAQVYNVLNTFEAVKNEFITTLVNRCVKTQFFSKVYENPLKMLHNGLIPFGDSIQQIFVRLGERKGFNDHFDDNGSAEKDLIGKRVPTVDVDYISQNFAHKYKVSVSDLQLKTAFLNDTGLQSLVTQLINNNISTANRDEYLDMKGILTRPSAETKDGHKYEEGVIYQIAKHKTLKTSAIIKTGNDPRNLCEKLRAFAKKLTFISNKYNLVGVETFSENTDLVFFTTPEMSAKVDVNVLAQAFNVSSAEINVRTIIVDELPQNLMVDSANVGNVTGVLADKYLIQAWDIINTSKSFDNGDGLYTNYFLHKQGIMSFCKFAQCVIFTDGE